MGDPLHWAISAKTQTGRIEDINVLDPLEIPRPKTETPGNSAAFLINPWKFYMLFLVILHAISDTPVNSISSPSPLFGFFLEEPIFLLVLVKVSSSKQIFNAYKCNINI